MVRLSLLLPFALLGACDNPCQQLCTDMADYAQECGYDVSSSDISSCRDKYSNEVITSVQAQECLEADDPEQIREWWTCEELLENYQSAG